MRKRVSEIVAAALLCACLALAGTMALAVAGLLDDGPTAQATPLPYPPLPLETFA